MKAVRVLDAAEFRIGEIYRYSRDRWGKDQADSYIRGLFDAFTGIAEGIMPSRPISAELGVHGFCLRYRKHIIYWKFLENGDVGIVTILHERMHRIERLSDDFGFDEN